MTKKNSYNSKVRNARKVLYDGIGFDSKLEVSCYKLLKENNINFTYNEDKILLFEGLKLENTVFYQPNSKNEYVINTRKVLNTTYTPFFRIITNNGLVIYVETKGKENDVYPLKRKMFLKWLEQVAVDNEWKCYFFEPHNVGQIKETIEVILLLLEENEVK